MDIAWAADAKILVGTFLAFNLIWVGVAVLNARRKDRAGRREQFLFDLAHGKPR